MCRFGDVMPIKREATIGEARLLLGNCLEIMPTLGKVDAILTDPPYGTTSCKWDSVLDLQRMWHEIKNLAKPRTSIIMTASQPFTTALIASNIQMFKYELIWDKCVGGAFVLAKKRVLPAHENILLFSCANKYNPQMSIKPEKDRRPERPESKCTNEIIKTSSGTRKQSSNYEESKKYPTSVLYYPKQMAECNNTRRVHPTQKPVALMEYLLKTYTDRGDIVLDFTMGSGSTGVACVNIGRKFIGIELEEKYFDISCERIYQAQRQGKMF